jgi:hypothetical protein
MKILSSGLTITTVNRVESLKHNCSYNCELWSFTLSKWAAVNQMKFKDNTSKSHEGEIHKQPTIGNLNLTYIGITEYS